MLLPNDMVGWGLGMKFGGVGPGIWGLRFGQPGHMVSRQYMRGGGLENEVPYHGRIFTTRSNTRFR